MPTENDNKGYNMWLKKTVLTHEIPIREKSHANRK